VIDAVGMEAHSAPFGKLASSWPGCSPRRRRAAHAYRRDRLAAFHLAIDLVRRGGTVSLAGVYGGMLYPVPMLVLFDKQVQLRTGQVNVKRWVRRPAGRGGLRHHRLPRPGTTRLRDVPKKQECAVKVLLRP
jgi:threonine dehydrogenase-like Zn-dependent dehydrogenase